MHYFSIRTRSRKTSMVDINNRYCIIYIMSRQDTIVAFQQERQLCLLPSAHEDLQATMVSNASNTLGGIATHRTWGLRGLPFNGNLLPTQVAEKVGRRYGYLDVELTYLPHDIRRNEASWCNLRLHGNRQATSVDIAPSEDEAPDSFSVTFRERRSQPRPNPTGDKHPGLGTEEVLEVMRTALGYEQLFYPAHTQDAGFTPTAERVLGMLSERGMAREEFYDDIVVSTPVHANPPVKLSFEQISVSPTTNKSVQTLALTANAAYDIRTAPDGTSCVVTEELGYRFMNQGDFGPDDEGHNDPEASLKLQVHSSEPLSPESARWLGTLYEHTWRDREENIAEQLSSAAGLLATNPTTF